MPEPPKQTKVLKKTSENVTMQTDDFVRVPRHVFEQMKSIIKGLASNGGRAKTLAAEIETIK